LPGRRRTGRRRRKKKTPEQRGISGKNAVQVKKRYNPLNKTQTQERRIKWQGNWIMKKQEKLSRITEYHDDPEAGKSQRQAFFGRRRKAMSSASLTNPLLWG